MNSGKSILNASVLVLNEGWQPVNVTIFREAVGLILKDRAEIVVHEDLKDKFGNGAAYKYEVFGYNEWIKRSEVLDSSYPTLNSAKYKHFRPYILKVKSGQYVPNYYIKLSRKSIYNRDLGRCMYCDIKMDQRAATIDHVKPRSKGGKNTWDNMVLSCKPCNGEKGDMSLAESNMKLLRKPIKPSAFNFEFVYKEEYAHWGEFLKGAN